MPHTLDRIEFAPPPQGGTLRALGLAAVAHLVLLGALTWGVQWNRSDSAPRFEAELWSDLPQQAAPREVLAPPPAPAAEPPKPPAPTQREADIALEKEKKRKDLEKQREQDALKKEQAKDKAQREADEKKARDKAEKLKAEAETAKMEADRKRNLERIAGLAGASGAPGASGSAQQSSGPSASYGGRVKARVKPNIVFTDEVPGNPAAEIEVRTAPDGTIIGTPRVLKSSGLRAWDEAVVRALEKTEKMPPDSDGRVPSPLIILFRPKEMLN